MDGQFPMPPLDDDSRPFWEGASRHKLMIQRCKSCQKHIFYPRFVCPHCFSEEVEWVEASGKGKIHSYTIVHRAPPPFQGQAPYAVGLIELEEGVRMISRIVGPRENISIDKAVSVVFEKVNDELTLPYFQLAE